MGPILFGFREWVTSQETSRGSSKYQSLSGFDYLYYELKKREETFNPQFYPPTHTFFVFCLLHA
jgi:hypothetical protein